MNTTLFAKSTICPAVLVFALLLFGCSLAPRKAPRTPALHFETKEGSKIELSGDAQEPAKISEGSTRTEAVLPMGSTIDVIPTTPTESGKIAVNLAADSSLVSVTKTQTVEGPRAFAPEKPPSPIEIARGKVVLAAYGLSGLLALAGFGMLYLQHYKAGGFFLLGAIAVPIAANLVTNQIALIVGGGFGLIGLTLYSAWHLMQRKAEVSVTKTETQKTTLQATP